ncbi:MAG: hypothetical protein HYX48_06630 [Chlamydiales bacterium]|nr:hypothetical protein [Chlamydiales bacterium]
MESSSGNAQLGSKLLITFPKSNEDHRLQLVGINGAIFAIVYSPLESQGPIRLSCEEWSLVLLAPLKSRSNILVSATNVICLSEIASEEGSVNIHASNRLVKFAGLFKSPKEVCEMGECGEYQFVDDPGAFLYYYRLFEGIVSSAHGGSPDALSQAQQQVITGLCTLADKIEGKPENLDLQKVFDIWNIPHNSLQKNLY